MRAFLAIELPGAVRRALGEAQRSLAADTAGWRWTRSEGIHLTLRFLGDVGLDAIARATPEWRAAASSIEPFTMRVAGLGVFPSMRRPRVLWAGAADEPDAGRLAALAERIESASVSAGLARADREFTPHLTLARAADAAGTLPAVPPTIDAGTARVSEVVLFQSELRPQGAVHTALERFLLGENLTRAVSAGKDA